MSNNWFQQVLVIFYRSQGGANSNNIKFSTMHSGAYTIDAGGQKQEHKEKKIGHRRVKIGGEVTYKKIVTTQLIGSIQLGVHHAVGSLANVPHRDLLMQDFMSIGNVNSGKHAGHTQYYFILRRARGA